MRMIRQSAATFLLFLLTVSAIAQEKEPNSKDDTFQQIGKELQSISNALKQGDGAAPLQAGDVRQVLQPAPMFQSANQNSSLGAFLEPNTPVKILGKKDGFTQVAPLTSGWTGKDPVYVRDSSIWNFGVPSLPSVDVVQTALDKLQKLQDKLENNKYVKLKGFNVSLGTTISIEAQFEMK